MVAYHTEWYPNDGRVADYSQASVHTGEQSISVSDLATGAHVT